MDFQRQMDIFNPREHNRPVVVIGAGGTGSFTVLSLAKMGLSDITVYDHDRVEPHNIPNQLFRTMDTGRLKAEALSEIVREFTGTRIKAIPERFSPKTRLPENCILVSAVDNMRTRQMAFQSATRGRVELLLDPRTGGETIRLLSVPLWASDARSYYASSLYEDSEASELPCTARTIIDVGFIVAALITRAVRRYLRDGTYEPEIAWEAGSAQLLHLGT